MKDEIVNDMNTNESVDLSQFNDEQLMFMGYSASDIESLRGTGGMVDPETVKEAVPESEEGVPRQERAGKQKIKEKTKMTSSETQVNTAYLLRLPISMMQLLYLRKLVLHRSMKSIINEILEAVLKENPFKKGTSEYDKYESLLKLL